MVSLLSDKAGEQETELQHLVCSQPVFEALLHENLRGMRALAMRYTRSADKADDLVNDTVVRALTFRSKFRADSNFKAWIYTVLTHTFMNHFRRQKREKEILGQVSRFDVLQNLRSEQTRRNTREPEKSLLHATLNDDVSAAMARLPEEFRQVVELCDLQSLSYREVASALGCPLGTVMSRLYRGRRLLQDSLSVCAAEAGIGSVPAATPAPARRRAIATARVVAPRGRAAHNRA